MFGFSLKKLKSACWFITLAALFFFSVAAYPREVMFGCLASKTMIAEQMKSGYAYFSTAIYNNQAVVQLYINTEGHWRLIGVDTSLTSCVLMQGTDWNFIYSVRI